MLGLFKQRYLNNAFCSPNAKTSRKGTIKRLRKPSPNENDSSDDEIDDAMLDWSQDCI